MLSKVIKTDLLRALIAVAAVLTLVAGCSSPAFQQNKGAAVGAGAGAATGAVVGEAAGGHALVGGLLGALVGGAVGHYAYDVKHNGQDTASMYNYSPSQGSEVNLENTTATPATVNPGSNVDIKMTYALLTPSGNTPTQVTETRTITHNGQQVGQIQNSVSRANGTYTSTVPIQLPASASPGTYNVTSIVQAAGRTSQQTTTFTVG